MNLMNQSSGYTSTLFIFSKDSFRLCRAVLGFILQNGHYDVRKSIERDEEDGLMYQKSTLPGKKRRMREVDIIEV